MCPELMCNHNSVEKNMMELLITLTNNVLELKKENERILNQLKNARDEKVFEDNILLKKIECLEFDVVHIKKIKND